MFSLKDWLLISLGGALGTVLFVILFSFGFPPLLLVLVGFTLTLTGYFCFALGEVNGLFDWKNLFAQAVGLGLVIGFCIFGILNKF